MVTPKEIIEELRGECNGCKRDMLADRIESEGIAPNPYVPMTDDEILELVRFFTTLGFPISRYTKRVECEIIKRAGLEIKHD